MDETISAILNSNNVRYVSVFDVLFNVLGNQSR
jgi:hypothetical protein